MSPPRNAFGFGGVPRRTVSLGMTMGPKVTNVTKLDQSKEDT